MLAFLGWALARPVELRVVAREAPGGKEKISPLAGACLSAWRETAAGYVLLDRTTTDDKGSGVLSVPAEGHVILRVWKEGFVPQELEMEGPPAKPLTLQLSRGATVRLRVRDSKGNPVKHFRFSVLPSEVFDEVTREGADPWVVSGPAAARLLGLEAARTRRAFLLEPYVAHEVETEEGEVSIGGLDDREYVVLLGVPDYGVARHDFAVGERVWEVTLDWSSCWYLRVTDRTTGLPVAGAFLAPLRCIAEGELRDLWPAWPTGPDGMLAVGCPGEPALPSWEWYLVAPERAPEVVRQPLASARKLSLGPGARIEGTALDEEGRPLAGLRVRAIASGFLRSATVAGDGTFVLDQLPAGVVDLWVEAEEAREGPPLAFTRVEVEPDQRREVRLTPQRAFQLVLTKNGAPWGSVEAALVEVVMPGPRAVIFATGRADGDGRCFLRAPEDAGGELVLVVRDGEQVVTVPLPRKGLLGRIKSWILGASKEESLRVDVAGEDFRGVVTAEDSGLPLEGHRVVVTDGSACSTVAVKPGSPLHLKRLRGQLRLCNALFAQTATDRAGRFEIFAPEGATTLKVDGFPIEGESGDRYESFTTKLDEIDVRETLRIRLRKTARLHVRVTHVSGSFPAGCVVRWQRVVPGPGRNEAGAICSEAGVELYPPANDAFIVVAEAPQDGRSVKGPFVLRPGERRQVEMTLSSATGNLRILVEQLPSYEGHYYVLPGTLTDEAGRDWTFITPPKISTDGRQVLFEALPVGRWRVRLGDKNRQVMVRENDETLVDLRH